MLYTSSNWVRVYPGSRAMLRAHMKPLCILQTTEIFVLKWFLIHSCVFRRKGPCKMQAYFSFPVICFTMYHSASDSSTVQSARDKKAIDTETPAPPAYPSFKFIKTKHTATCAKHINTVPLVSEEVNNLNAKFNPCLSKFPGGG